MQEYRSLHFILRTDKNEYKINNAQKDIILRAESAGKRFVDLGMTIINIAFIREIERVETFRDELSLKEFPLTEEDKKFLVSMKGQDELGRSNKQIE